MLSSTNARLKRARLACAVASVSLLISSQAFSQQTPADVPPGGGTASPAPAKTPPALPANAPAGPPPVASPAATSQQTPGATPDSRSSAIRVDAPGDAATPQVEHYEFQRQPWTFSGLLGHFDEEQLRRGYKVYKTVCSNCHNMRFMYFRNLGQPGGPNFPKDVVEQAAAETEVTDGFDETGAPKVRPGKPADHFVWKFKNEAEARAALGGALPPDLSVMAKARTYEREVPWYTFPFTMLKDIGTQYQEQGPDYIYGLLNGYKDPPPNKKIPDGLYYNVAFPGNQIAMPQPLTDGAVDYEDGTPNTLDQESKDVIAYLTWAAEPHLVERKKLGLWVLGYLLIVSVLLFLSKRSLWRNVEH